MIGRRKSKQSPREIRESTEAAAEQLQSQKAQVTFISDWLARRYMQNGFGEDLDITIVPKEAK